MFHAVFLNSTLIQNHLPLKPWKQNLPGKSYPFIDNSNCFSFTNKNFFFAYWILGDGIRISERINDRFKNEGIWNRDKIGFLLDFSTDICPIRTFVLEHRRLRKMGRLKRTVRPRLILYCWIWTLKNCIILVKNVTISNLFFFTFYQKQIDYWNIHGQIGVEKHQNRKSVPNDFLGIQYNIRQHNHRHKLLGNALPD